MNGQTARTIRQIAMIDPRVPYERKRKYYRRLKRQWNRIPRDKRGKAIARLERLLINVNELVKQGRVI